MATLSINLCGMDFFFPPPNTLWNENRRLLSSRHGGYFLPCRMQQGSASSVGSRCGLEFWRWPHGRSHTLQWPQQPFWYRFFFFFQNKSLGSLPCFEQVTQIKCKSVCPEEVDPAGYIWGICGLQCQTVSQSLDFHVIVNNSLTVKFLVPMFFAGTVQREEPLQHRTFWNLKNTLFHCPQSALKFRSHFSWY